MTGERRRLVFLLVALAAVTIPAGVLRATCVGNSCSSGTGTGPIRVPFCSLPSSIRTLIAAGYAADRSPDVVAVTTRSTAVVGSVGRGGSSLPVPWPSEGAVQDAQVPLVFVGPGVAPRPLGPGVGLGDVAPTLAAALGIDLPRASLRSHSPLDIGSPASPRVLLEIVWKGIGSKDVRGAPHAWPYLRSLERRGSFTHRASIGSLPVDPTAVLATLATGAPPTSSGIVGTTERSPYNRARVRIGGALEPPMSVSTLADELDREEGQRSVVGIAGTDPADRIAIGGFFYVPSDHDVGVFRPGGARMTSNAAVDLLEHGRFGSDRIPDLLAVVLDDTVAHDDAATRAILRAARSVSRDSVLTIVTGTGSLEPNAPHVISASRIVQEVERESGAGQIVDFAGPGGLYLEQAKGVQVSAGAVATALKQLTGPGDRPIIADAFPGFAVALARFC
jgi:hypothetical protein